MTAHTTARIKGHHSTLISVQLYVLDCPNCGIVFAINTDYEQRRRADGQNFNCPNGHSIGWDSTDAKKRTELEEQVERLKHQRDYQAAEAAAARARAQAERRKTSAAKGQLTKMRNRVARGMCPQGGCKRNFDKLADHVRTEHPELLDTLTTTKETS